jgi:hypothetical protein
VKHAGGDALRGLSVLLDQIRSKDGIREKKLGIFYRKSKAFLHFHEDPAGMFADLSVDGEFQRFPVNSKGEWKVFLSAVERELRPER